jgi:excisionase family DNA binding protein
MEVIATMNTLLARDETVIPDEADTALAVESSRLLATAKPEEELRVRLENGTEIPLPKGASKLLSHLLVEMGNGNAVTLVPIHAEFTTQEAADYLNVSRPYFVALLEKGAFPFTKIGSHRRIKFNNLLRYKKKLEAESEAAQRELAAISQELGMGY